MVKLQKVKDQHSVSLPRMEVERAGWKKGDRLRIVFNDRNGLMEIEKMVKG